MVLARMNVTPSEEIMGTLIMISRRGGPCKTGFFIMKMVQSGQFGIWP